MLPCTLAAQALLGDVTIPREQSLHEGTRNWSAGVCKVPLHEYILGVQARDRELRRQQRIKEMAEAEAKECEVRVSKGPLP